MNDEEIKKKYHTYKAEVDKVCEIVDGFGSDEVETILELAQIKSDSEYA